MATTDKHVGRRGFLKGAVAGAAAGAATIVLPTSGQASPSSAEPLEPGQGATVSPPITPADTARMIHAADTDPLPPEEQVFLVDNPGSDFMVDVIKTLGFEYIASNPASNFRGIHESFINYNHNTNPEWLTCCHEEASVNIANGYYAVSGKPMAVLTFATCGVQHASMAIMGSYTGHSPTYIMCGNILDAVERRPANDWWEHSVVDAAALCRDFLKWDDTPLSLQHFAESAVRAYKMAMTEPRGPVMLVVDATL